MPTSPESNINLNNGVEFQRQPTLTYDVDPVSRRISGMCEGYKAVKQTVEIILNIERFRWQIYSPYFGMQWDGLIGQHPGWVAPVWQSRMLDAFSVDDRITGISDFQYTINGENMTATLTVDTIYGGVQETVEVTLT